MNAYLCWQRFTGALKNEGELRFIMALFPNDPDMIRTCSELILEQNKIIEDVIRELNVSNDTPKIALENF